MKKRYFSLCLVILMIFSINAIFGVEINATDDYQTSISEDNNYQINENEDIVVGEVNQNQSNVKITTNDLVKYYQNDSQFEFNIEENDKNCSGASVNLTINNQSYTRITDDNGSGKLSINLAPGNYSIVTSYKNTSVKNNIVVLSFLQGNNLVKYYQNDSQFVFKVLNKSDGTSLANVDVSLNINGVLYNRTTNASGFGRLAINLAPGNYVVTYSYDNLAVSNNITVLSTIKANNLVKYYQNDSQFIFEVLNKSDGTPVANANVLLNINGVLYNRTTNESGLGKLSINLNPGDYIITIYHDNLAVSNNITVLSFLQGEDVVKYYLSNVPYSVKVLNKSNGMPINNTVVLFNINGVFYNRTTNESGIAKLNLNLNPGDYVVTAYYDGLALGNSVKILPRLFGEDISSTYGNSVEFKVNYLDDNGKAVANKLITFNVEGQIYTSYTDDNGIATINLNNDAGNYVITYFSDDLTSSNSYVVKNSYSLTTLNWGTGADVTKNSLIKSNVPDSELLNQVVDAAKSGTPLMMFKGGEGKTVFITAGIHGSELSSQVAAMRLINYLETNPIKGTVYIIPFIQPKATANNVRNYNNINLNSVANVAGTVSNNAVNLIVSVNTDSYGDFHCTMPGGDPGKDVAMGSYSPTAESATIANYISQTTGVSKLIYNVAGSEYSGAMEDTVNILGIPAVTCEVLTPHGTIASGSVETSFSMMKALLQYNGLI